MSNISIPITITILGKEYQIACPKEEKDRLLASAKYLDHKLREIRNSGKVAGSDRIIVLAALNITHELLTQQWQRKHDDVHIRTLNNRLSTLLEESE